MDKESGQGSTRTSLNAMQHSKHHRFWPSLSRMRRGSRHAVRTIFS